MKKKKKNDKSLGLKIFDIFLNISFVVFIICIGVAVYFYVKLPPLDVESMVRPNDSYVYDKNDKLIGTISRKKENQTNIPYASMNQSIINTLVGTEDSTFFTHKGVDILNTFESGFKSALNIGSKSGGSSITQQIIGWSHLDRNDRSVSRKISEILLSFKAEQSVDKTEIMEMYLNYFFYGKNNIHGIEKASEYFFDKHSYDLDYIQSALMTGTLNAPSQYNPLGTYTEVTGQINNSKKRLDNVLMANLHQGYITDKEYYLLQQVPVENTVKINDVTKNAQYNSYVDLVRREMEEKYKVDLTKTSTKIYTNMDVRAQRQADKITNNKAAGVKLPNRYMNFGFMMTRTQDGGIVAVSGGKQYRKGGEMLLNNAVDLQNQPGSAIKPIIDYAPAYEYLHWPERAPISNATLKYRGTNQTVHNVDRKAGGIMTIDAALANSRNLTAIRALEAVTDKVGFKELNNFLTKLGFEFSDAELEGRYAYALGGTETGVSPEQMNGAYQAFGNGGKYIKPWTIRHYINTDTNKKIVNPTKPVQAIDEKTAFMMANALEKSTTSSTLLYAVGNISVPYTAKTGTSDWGKDGLQFGIPEGSQKDSWVAGYTNRYTLSVWSGYEAAGIKKGLYPQWGAPHDYAAYIFGSMMRAVTNGKEKSYQNMKAPKGLVKMGISPRTVAPFSQGSLTSWVYQDTKPKGVVQKQYQDKDFPAIRISYLDNALTVTFGQVDIAGVSLYVQIGNGSTNKGGTYRIKNGQSFTAYYLKDGQAYQKISGCLKKEKLTTSGCSVMY